jgi:hypothetical protein
MNTLPHSLGSTNPLPHLALNGHCLLTLSTSALEQKADISDQLRLSSS